MSICFFNTSSATIITTKFVKTNFFLIGLAEDFENLLLLLLLSPLLVEEKKCFFEYNTIRYNRIEKAQ